MGLDMYLNEAIYIGSRLSNKDIEIEINEKVNGIPTKKRVLKNVYEIRVDVAYWKNADAIHNWFVDNCGDGYDSGDDVYLTSDTLKELLKACKEVEADPSKADSLIPDMEKRYDNRYMENIKSTIEQLSNIDFDNSYEFYYHGSW